MNNVNGSRESVLESVSESAWESEEVRLPAAAVYISMVFVVTLGLVGLLGNSLTSVIVWHKLREKSMYKYIFVLSVSDLIYVLTSLTYTIPLLVTGGTLDLAVVMGCNVLPLAMFLPAHTSAWMVVCISIERALFSARLHTGDHLGHHATRLVIVALLAAILALNFPFLGGLRPVDVHRLWFVDGCRGANSVMVFVLANVYPWIEISVYLVLPTIIIISCNTVIVLCARKRRKQIGAALGSTGTGSSLPQTMQLQSMHPTSSSTSQAGTQGSSDKAHGTTYPTQPSSSLTPPAKPSSSLTPPAKPSSSLTPPLKPSSSLTPPMKPSGSLILPTKPSGSLTPPMQPSGSLTPPTKPSGSLTSPMQPSGSLTPPTKPSDPPPDQGLAPPVHPSQPPAFQPRSQASLSKERSAHRLTKTCVLVSAAYVLLAVPSYGVFIVYEWVDSKDKKWVELMLKVISFLFSLSNHCINCLLYCLTGSIFRKEVYKRLKKLSCVKT